MAFIHERESFPRGRKAQNQKHSKPLGQGGIIGIIVAIVVVIVIFLVLYLYLRKKKRPARVRGLEIRHTTAT
ncbi:hypothetical protein CC78DRAFT_536841 [Lojkania enalia]|uniref:Uncharacterized protein n=1 Tax=Lojkania enalia TaxID=147567 RepID=A0A9P4K1W1_9PLEO|nr:hypothetical protein CC78DRAFT_536841 [Didymosphaeria enalia]